MKRTVVSMGAAALALLIVAALAVSPDKSGVPATAARDALFSRTVDGLFPSLVEVRRDLHRNPELSNEESRTAGVVAEKLKALGLEVKTGVGGHGVVALLHGSQPGRVVAVRADMDALPIDEQRDLPFKSQRPGVMHACGHDVHTAAGLGVAELLARHRDQWRGTVKFIFQPAEEAMPASFKGTWGALRMMEEGVMENPKPEAIFALHCAPLVTLKKTDGEATEQPLPAGMLGYVNGMASANSDRFQITIKGQMAHGSAPQRGVDAITVAASAVQELQTIRSRKIDTREPFVLTVGTIHGGNRENIIAPEVVLTGTVRTYSTTVQKQVIEWMHKVLKGVTTAHGAEYELQYRIGYPSIPNHAGLAARVLPALRRVAGPDRVVESLPGMGGEDFSYFAQKVPGFYFLLGVAKHGGGELPAGVHTPQFEADEESLRTAVKAMAAAVCTVLDEGL